MPESHADASLSILDAAYAAMRSFVRNSTTTPVGDFERFETALLEHLAELGRAGTRAALVATDPQAPSVLVDGVTHRRVGTFEKEYMTACGPVTVPRGLYRARRNGPTACPLELRGGFIAFWTPKAARMAAIAVALGTPREVETLFRETTLMRPSRSSLDRLPKALGSVWESHREEFEEAVRCVETVPAKAVTMAVLMDGVLVHMRDGGASKKRSATYQNGQQAKGPAGYQEVGCGAICLYDQAGNRLSTKRFARMPEAGKPTLKRMIEAEATRVLQQRPEMVVVKLADGALNNWSFLESLPGTHSIVDYYHATEHLARALDGILGANSPLRRLEFERLRRVLRDDHGGVDQVIARLQKLASARKKVGPRIGLRYFLRHRSRMKYAEATAAGLPIGSGVIEGTCRTLVSDRMKRAGMRWRDLGGQGILTLRAALQSDRFEASWSLIAQTYRREAIAA